MKKKSILIGLVALKSLLFAQIPTTGLIAKWEFTGNLNDGIGTNNGSWQPSGSPTYVADRCGNASSAINFNGTSNFIKMLSSGISGSGARSISFWMRTTNSSGSVRTMFSDGQASSSNTGTRWEINHNYFCQGVGIDISSEVITKPDACVNDGVWHHIVVIQGANTAFNTAVIYLDAVQMNGTNCSPTSNNGLNATIAQLITIGALYNGALPGAPLIRFFSGDLDDFYYYNTALTQSQVVQLYYNKCTVAPDPLCANSASTPPNPSPSSCCLGNLCSNSQNPIAGNYEIPLNNNNFYFSGDNTTTNKTNFGFPCGATPNGKLNVTTAFKTNLSLNESYSIYSTNTYASGTNGVGIYGEANVPVNGNSNEYGVWGKALGGRSTTGVFGQALTCNTTSGIGTGGFFESVSANQDNIGVNGSGRNATRQNVGVNGQGQNGIQSYGGKFSAFGASNLNIGVAGSAGTVGAPTYPATIAIGVYGQVLQPGTNFAGYFDGDVNVNGVGTISGGPWSASDRRFKTDINTLNKSIEILMKLKPKSYLYDTKNKYGINFYDKKSFGFIAQELEEVIPELVRETTKPAMKNEKGEVITESIKYKTVNYDGLIAFLVSGAQEQQTQIVKQNEAILNQQQQIDELKAVLKSLANNTNAVNDKSLAISLSDKNAIVLNQNVPNPFAESTVITFNVPTNFTKAQIIFNTSDGKIIKTVDITIKGEGSLNVFANDLSSGIYSYTLVIDGKNIETRRMVKK